MSAVATEVRPTFPRSGVMRLFETHFGLWEKDVDERGMRQAFLSILGRLRFRGFKLRQRQDVHECIRAGYWLGRKGDLEIEAEHVGRHIKIEFFQNLNIENPNGGRYDFDKFHRMPRAMQLQCVVELAALHSKALELGYAPDPRYGNPTLLGHLRIADGSVDRDHGTLEHFNRQWDGDYDRRRGSGHRFERDETGWPSEKELTNPNRDRDGVRVRNGDVRYARHRGRLVRGVVRPNMNEMWFLTGATYLSAFDLFFCERPDLEPRRWFPDQPRRLRAVLDRALKANDYRRVSAVSAALARLVGSEAAR